MKRSYLLVFLSAVVLYSISCSPGLLWQDSGVIQYRVWHNDIEGGMGLALSHPLFYLAAIAVKYLPFGAFPYKINLISAVAAAVAVANIFLLARLWLKSTFAALVAAATFAFSHTFWWHAAIAETYTLYTAFLTAELVVLLRYTQSRKTTWLYLLGLLNGLALAVHMLAAIPLACYAVYVLFLWRRRELQFRTLLLMALLWVIGAAPYEFLILRRWLQNGDLMATLSSAAFGDQWKGAVLNTAISLGTAKENLLFLLLNFPTPNLLLLPIGLYALLAGVLPARKAFRTSHLVLSTSKGPAAFNILVLILAALFLLFAFRYTIVDRYAFFIPFYCLASLLIGAGAWYLLHRTAGRRRTSLCLCAFVPLCLFLPIPAYILAPAMAQRAGVNLGTRRTIAYRDDYTYFLQPWKTAYHGADRFAREALENAEPGAIIYADGTTVYPLLLAQQIHGLRPDITVVSGHGTADNLKTYDQTRIDELFAARPIYAVSPVKSYCPDFLLERYDLQPSGILHRAVTKNH